MILFPAFEPGFALFLAVFALFGLLLGAMHFSALAWNVRLLTHGRRLAPAFALPLLRLALVGGGFAFAASHGAGALLACLAGLLAARAMALRIAAVPP